MKTLAAVLAVGALALTPVTLFAALRPTPAPTESIVYIDVKPACHLFREVKL